MKKILGKLTYANVMATIAVFIALGGASYAAMKLPQNSVGTKQLKKDAVTPAKLSTAAKSSITGATGPQGSKGDPGVKGEKGESGMSFSAVVVSGSFAGAHKGFTSVTNPGTGNYCLAVEPGVSFYHPIASIEWAGSTGSNILVEPVGREASSFCGPNELAVLTFTFSEATVTTSNEVNFIVSLPQD